MKWWLSDLCGVKFDDTIRDSIKFVVPHTILTVFIVLGVVKLLNL